jgi:hypothetical protein
LKKSSYLCVHELTYPVKINFERQAITNKRHEFGDELKKRAGRKRLKTTSFQ